MIRVGDDVECVESDLVYVRGRLCSATLGLVGDTGFSRESLSFSFAMKSKSSLSFISFSFCLACSAIRLRASSVVRERHLSSSSSFCLIDEEEDGAEAILSATLSANELLLFVATGSGFELTYLRLESREEDNTGDADLELEILRTPSGVV